MRAPGQVLVALVALVAIGAGVATLDDLGPRPRGSAAEPVVESGAWFCPHGGGDGWGVELAVVNPGAAPVEVRVRTLGSERAKAPRSASVPAGEQIWIEVSADERGSATVIEYFGGWVAAGWIARGGGVAADPCLPEAGREWLAPDGTTVEGNDAYLVVMNPFAADTVVDVTLFTEDGGPTMDKALTDVPIRGRRSVAFRLNPVRLGFRTVSARVTAAVGRVAVASLGVVRSGGIRSAVATLEPPARRTILPGGGDVGQSSLVVMNATGRKASFDATFFGLEELGTAGALRGTAQGGDLARAYTIETDGPGAIEVRTRSGELAVTRRTIGTGADRGATAGATPAAAWVVLPTVAGRPSTARLYLSNPGDADARVTLAFVGQERGGFEVTVPAGRTVGVSKDFAARAPRAAVLAVAEAGTFVPVSASSSLGKLGLSGYAVSVGIPVPSGVLPA